jgi:protein TonB
MARRKKKLSTVYVVSIAAHLAVGAALALVPQDKLREVVAIALNETKEEKKKAEPPKPQPHTENRPARAPGHNARPAAVAQAAAPTPGSPASFQDIGLALDSSSADGIAVAVAPQPTAIAAPVIAAAPPKPKVLVAHHTEDTCTEEIVRARPISRVAASYTTAGRNAHVEGRVRIELMVNEQGEVVSAKVLSGLGYGLDEAALAAAQRFHFAPATRCGRPVMAPFVLGMRFRLSS